MPFETWIAALETRHLADLTFAETSRALRALSSTYVERRQRLGEGAALAGAGKRAAFALFYGPLHFLLVDRIVRALPDAMRAPGPVVDLGCGTGTAGIAWALAGDRARDVVGVDRSAWALDEAAWNYRAFGIHGRAMRGDVARVRLPAAPAPVVAAFALNELERDARDQLLTRLLDSRGRRRVLVVEPLARGAAPWWDSWAARAQRAGGRIDEWRFRAELPPIVAKLDRAAGLDHRELRGRSMFW
jgi:SAM-dependent methyltransferase